MSGSASHLAISSHRIIPSAEEIIGSQSDKYFKLNQFSNISNICFHLNWRCPPVGRSTGREDTLGTSNTENQPINIYNLCRSRIGLTKDPRSGGPRKKLQGQLGKIKQLAINDYTLPTWGSRKSDCLGMFVARHARGSTVTPSRGCYQRQTQDVRLNL